MTFWGAALIVLICAVAAGLGAMLIDRLLSMESRRNHHEVGSAVFQQVGVMFSVLLAFVFSGAWQEHNVAAQSVNGECGALHGAAILANAMPNHTGRPVNVAIVASGRLFIDTEWPMLARGERSPQATQAFRIALDTAARLPVRERADVAMRNQILTLIAQAHADRETRTFEAGRGLPAPLWWVLIAVAGLLVTFIVLAGVDTPGHVLLSAAFAASTVGVLVTVRMLEFPFQGSLAVSSDDFAKLLGEVTMMLAGA